MAVFLTDIKFNIIFASLYIPRTLHSTLERILGQFPAVLVTGPRQSGKTTFLQEEFGKSFEYLSFDDPLERGFAIKDPNGFLDRFKGTPVILDEIQYVPEILPYLKIRIDRNRKAAGQSAQEGILVCRVNEPTPLPGGNRAMPWHDFPGWLGGIL